MTDIEQKALALLNAVAEEMDLMKVKSLDTNLLGERALCRAIEQHEAFRQEVSDALSVYQKADGVEERSRIWDALTRFIIAKPDPLAECLLELDLSEVEQEARHDAEWLVKTIEKRGGKLTWGEG